MSEGQAEDGPEPQDPVVGLAPSPGRQGADPAAVLLAVERVRADVAALGRALASQPEEVSARLDVDAAIAAVGVRVGALGSALDQLRLSLLAALDRSAERVDAPAWLPAVQAALTELAPPPDGPDWLPGLHVALADVGSRIDRPAWLAELLAALDHAATRFDTPRWLPDLRAVLTDAATRLDSPSWLPDLNAALADRPGPEPVLEAIAAIRTGEQLDHLMAAVAAADPGERLARVEQAVAELADGVRAGAAVGDALEDLGQRLASIEDAAGRVADDARMLVERVAPVPDRLSAIASQVDRITPLARAGDNAGTLFDRLDHVGASLVEVIAMLRARGGGPGDDVEERFEGIVDVLAGVTRRQDQVTAAIASVLDQVRGPKGVDAVLDRMEQRERSLAARLDRIDAELRRTRDGGTGSSVEARAKPDGETARAFEVVAAMMEQQERVLTARLDQIEGELQSLREAAGATRPDGERPALDTMLERIDRQQQAMSIHLEWVGERLAEVAARLVPDAPQADDAAPGPLAIGAVFDRMEQRERSLVARLDRIDAELRRATRGAPAGAGPVPAAAPPDPDPGAAGSLAASVESIAATTGDLARLIESTAERLEGRIARVESGLGKAPPTAPPPRPTTPPEAAALRLAELRAERALVQARLQEERLLAAQTWDEES